MRRNIKIGQSQRSLVNIFNAKNTAFIQLHQFYVENCFFVGPEPTCSKSLLSAKCSPSFHQCIGFWSKGSLQKGDQMSIVERKTLTPPDEICPGILVSW